MPSLAVQLCLHGIASLPRISTPFFFRHERLLAQTNDICCRSNSLTLGSCILRAVESSSKPNEVKHVDGPYATGRPSSEKLDSTICKSPEHCFSTQSDDQVVIQVVIQVVDAELNAPSPSNTFSCIR